MSCLILAKSIKQIDANPEKIRAVSDQQDVKGNGGAFGARESPKRWISDLVRGPAASETIPTFFTELGKVSKI